MPIIDPSILNDAHKEYLQHLLKRAGFERLTVQVSGGVDSAVALADAVTAVGPENVNAAYIGIESSDESRERAHAVAASQGVPLIDLELTDFYADLEDRIFKAVARAGTQPTRSDFTRGSLKSTLRAPVARYINRITGNGLLLGTGNEDEDYFVRYCQRGGDAEVDCNHLSHHSKGEIRQYALYKKVPLEVVMATPTPDLLGVGDKQNDEEELTAQSGGVPWSYSTVDAEGSYTKVGTLEAMARWIDFIAPRFCSVVKGPEDCSFFSVYGADPEGARGTLEMTFKDSLAKFGLTVDHAVSALTWERKTRYKHNPALPSGIPRHVLITAGALTNELPDLTS